jgi:hypothetical protein
MVVPPRDLYREASQLYNDVHAIYGMVKDHGDRLDRIEIRLGRVEAKQDAMQVKQDAMQVKQDTMDGKLDEILRRLPAA